MSWTSEEILDVMSSIKNVIIIMWCLAAVNTDVETSVLLYSALIRAQELQYPDLNCARVARTFLIRSFSESLIECGRSSNTILFF